VKAKIDHAALAFCRSTNATTSLDLATALRRLREELKAGIADEGEAIPKLAKRFRKVFEFADKVRATTIARTETSRAVHAARYASIEDSGVVQGLKILVSANACSLCQRLASVVDQVPLGRKIAVIGHNPDYMDIRHPPLHIRCRCSCTWVLAEEHGGPADPKWGETLIRPKVEDDEDQDEDAGAG
jgi:hypothetical protein